MNFSFSLRSAGAIFLIALLTVATGIAQTVVTDSRSGQPVIAGEILVKIRKGYEGSDAATAVRNLALRAGLSPKDATRISTVNPVPSDKTFGARIQSVPSDRRARVQSAIETLSRMVRLRFNASLTPSQAATQISKLKEIEYAEPIILPMTFAPPNDSLLPEQSHFALIHLLEAWELWQGDTNMVVGIVDSGVDMFHEDLAPNIKENPGETGKDNQNRDKRTNGVDDDGNGQIDDWRGANLTASMDSTTPGNTKGDGHGTVVAGFAAAATNNRIGVAGAAYKCRFFPVKTAPKNNAQLFKAYDGLIYCAERGMKVVNCSWGSNAYQQGLQDIIAGLVDGYDVAIVGGGGNAQVYDRFYPAGYRGVLGVGALTTENVLNTTWGEHIGVSSPCRFSTLEDNQYTPSGPATSFTTPVVSGVLALVRSKYPNLTAEQAIMHLRLTSDNVDSLNPGKAKLMGYGRINALRAIQMLPTSHPGIALDSVWTTDMNNVPKNNFAAGEQGKIWGKIRSVLGNATNIRLSGATYTADSQYIEFISPTSALASLPSGSSSVTTSGIVFRVKQPSSNIVRFRVDLVADGGYTDYYYQSLLLYKPFIISTTPKLEVTLTNNGHIGYGDYPDNRVGTGFHYDGSSFLFESGVMIAKDATHIVGNVRDASGDTQDKDFTVIESPTAANMNTVGLNDSAAASSGRMIGVELRTRLVTIASVPDAIGIQLRTKNVSGASIDSLRVAMFFDWDIDSTGDAQTVSYSNDPTKAVPVYGRVGNPTNGYFLSTGIAKPVTNPVFYAINNDGSPVNLYNGFDFNEKWTTLSNGVGSSSAGPADISMVIGKKIVGVAPNAEDTMLIVIGCGIIPANATSAMQEFATQALSSVGSETVAIEQRLIVLSSSGTTVPVIMVQAEHRNAQLIVFDALGRPVADLSRFIQSTSVPSLIRFNTHSLPEGMYYVRLSDGAYSESQKLVIVR